MRVFRCRDISPKYCPFEMSGDTAEHVIEQIVLHCKAEHGLTDETMNTAMVSLWTAHIREVADGS